MIPVAVLVDGPGAADARAADAARVGASDLAMVEHVSLVRRTRGFALVCWVRGSADVQARVALQLAVVRTLEAAGVVPVPDARTVLLRPHPCRGPVRRSGRHR
jgi:hypothetical protein